MPLLAVSPRGRLPRIAASSVPRRGAVPIAPSSVKCAVRSIRPAAGTHHRAPRQHDAYPCASAEADLTPLAHDYVDSGTAGLSPGSVPRGDRVRDQYGATAPSLSMRRRGIDCDDGSGVRLLFTVRIRVTKSVAVRLQIAATCESEDRCLRHRQSETRHPRWERCRAPISAL